MIPVFRAPPTSQSPAVASAMGTLWAEMARKEGHAPGSPKLDRTTAREAINALFSDGNWHSSDEIAEVAGIAKNNLRKYLGRMNLDRRSITLPRGGRTIEWRAA